MGRSAGPVAVLAGEHPSDMLLPSGPLQNQFSLHRTHSVPLSLLPAFAGGAGTSGHQSLEPGSCMQLEVGCSGSLMVVGGWGRDVAGPMLGGWSVHKMNLIITKGLPPIIQGA